MNNAFIEDSEETVIDTSTEEARLTRLLEAINSLLQNKDWRELQELHFNREKDRIERLLSAEAKTFPIVEREIYRLQGELVWASRYTDFTRWATLLKHQLRSLKK